jgi:hypothetical protein
MNEVFYNGEVVELDETIAKTLIAEYQATVWESIAGFTPDCEAVKILSNKLREHHILPDVEEDWNVEVLYIKLEILQEAIERATKTAYVNKFKREIRNLCKITGDDPDVEADFSDPA